MFPARGVLLSSELESEVVQTSRNASEITSASGAPWLESLAERSLSDMHRYDFLKGLTPHTLLLILNLDYVSNKTTMNEYSP